MRQGLATVELPGRFQILPGQPTLVLDVAHNPHSVAALAVNLDAMGFYPRTRAVFGAMQDKDLGGLVARIAPLVDAWYCTDLPLARAAGASQLVGTVRALRDDVPATAHASPAAALAAALAEADPADRILVFGSFLTVGGVLAQGLPRLGAPHAVS
jgi:dihydrofolate synthase/folylpolyglutamate synthase